MDGHRDIKVRGVSEALWRRLRVESVKHSVSTGAYLNLLMRTWFDSQDAHPAEAPHG